MEKYEKVKRNLKQIAINNFVGGIMWGLGATIGLSIILALLSIILAKLNFVPIIGDFVANINEYVLQNYPQLIR